MWSGGGGGDPINQSPPGRENRCVSDGCGALLRRPGPAGSLWMTFRSDGMALLTWGGDGDGGGQEKNAEGKLTEKREKGTLGAQQEWEAQR